MQRGAGGNGERGRGGRGGWTGAQRLDRHAARDTRWAEACPRRDDDKVLYVQRLSRARVQSVHCIIKQTPEQALGFVQPS